MKTNYEFIEEFRLTEDQNEQIRDLLHSCFSTPNYQFTRTYSKQIPPRRLLACDSEGLVGHLGLEHRVIQLNDTPAAIFDIIDLCVPARARGQGIASDMLSWVDLLGRKHKIDFLILFAQDDRLYSRNGFVRVDNPVRWVKIHEHQTIGIGEEPIQELMVKPLGARPWTEGLVDLLGYQS